jgi:hypothetical protein
MFGFPIDYFGLKKPKFIAQNLHNFKGQNGI